MSVLNSFAQHQNIKITSGNFQNEPSIAMDALNPANLVVGTNINNIYFSEDTGSTWQKAKLYSDYGIWGDPCIVSGRSAEFFYFHLSYPPIGWGDWLDRIICQKTVNGGKKWNEGTYMGLNGTKDQDKEWACFDRHNQIIYVCWTQFDKYESKNEDDYSNILFSKSMDFGESWSESVIISDIQGDCLDNDYTVEGATPAVGPNGQLFVAWSGHEKIYFDKSYDFGETWLENDRWVANMPGGWTIEIPGISRCNGMPVLACDTSKSMHRGNLYINWSDQRNGIDDTDIWLIKSTDEGDTWCNPIRVNDDLPGKHQFFCWMTIDQYNGNIYIIFYDRRNHIDHKTDVYLAVSKDGGESFVNEKISETPFYPEASTFFGDYTNITAYENIVRPVWTRLDTNHLSVWTAFVNTDLLLTKTSNQIPFASSRNDMISNDHLYFAYDVGENQLTRFIMHDFFKAKSSFVKQTHNAKEGSYMHVLERKNRFQKKGIYAFQCLTDTSIVASKLFIIH